MNRRKFLAATGLAVGAGAFWVSIDENHNNLTIDSTLALLNSLEAQPLSATGEWDLYQIFSHCAQSVELSMTGYPEHKPPIFKQTAGLLAFSAFNKKGKMSHNLSEGIPGAPHISSSEDYQSALKRFRRSLEEFKHFKHPLHPHFAYGELSKSEYERAHAMHFNNHLSEFVINPTAPEDAPPS